MDLSDKNEIQKKITKAKFTTASLVEGISSLNASLASFRERCFCTMSEIRSAADLIVNEVRLHEEKLIAKVQNVIDLKEGYVQQQKKILEDNISELQQSIDYTTDILNNNTKNDSNLDEWKNALVSQLDNLSTVQQSCLWGNDMDNDGKFLFIYANEQLLKSVASYGAIVDEVPDDFKFNQQDDADGGDDAKLEVNVIPVLTLNGAVFDVDAAINDDDDDDLESTDDDDTDSYDDSDSHGDSDDAKIDDKDSDDDKDDEVNDDDHDSNDSSKQQDDNGVGDDGGDDDDDDDKDDDSNGVDVDHHIVNKNLTKTNNLPKKPKLSTLL